MDSILKNVLDGETTEYKEQCRPSAKQYLKIVDKCFWILHSMIPFESKHPPVQESQASVTAAEEEKWALKAWVCPLQTKLLKNLVISSTQYLYHDYTYNIRTHMSVSDLPFVQKIHFKISRSYFISKFNLILALLLCWGAGLAIFFVHH